MKCYNIKYIWLIIIIGLFVLVLLNLRNTYTKETFIGSIPFVGKSLNMKITKNKKQINNRVYRTKESFKNYIINYIKKI